MLSSYSRTQFKLAFRTCILALLAFVISLHRSHVSPSHCSPCYAEDTTRRSCARDPAEWRSWWNYFGNDEEDESLKQDLLAVDEKREFSCNKCYKQFTAKRSLNHHIKSAHEEVRYPCDRCDYKATRKTSLRRHIDSIHVVKAIQM